MRTPPQAVTPPYTPYHPRWYRTPVSTYWWLHKWVYFRFVVRELTSFGVAYFCVMALFFIRALSLGPQAFATFQSRLANPLCVLFTVISLFLTLFHTTTWFSLSAHAMVIRVGAFRVPGVLITAGNYAAWLFLSAILAWFLLR